jgi:hypothetical protein
MTTSYGAAIGYKGAFELGQAYKTKWKGAAIG